MTLTLAWSPAIAQPARPAASRPAAASSATYDAVLSGMACKQHPSGRMDCDYRVGRSVRFIATGVGQEDVVITFVHADSTGDYTASIAPLHGCVVVKPGQSPVATQAAADSVSRFAYVSPKTGKVYRTWATCLSATRNESRGDTAKRPF